VIRLLDLASLDGNRSLVTIRAKGLTAETISGLERWGEGLRTEDGQLTLTVRNEMDIPELNRYLVSQGADVYAITPARESLEEIFIKTVGKDGGL
jgi:hypothetical protein